MWNQENWGTDFYHTNVGPFRVFVCRYPNLVKQWIGHFETRHRLLTGSGSHRLTRRFHPSAESAKYETLMRLRDTLCSALKEVEQMLESEEDKT
jgi:hypothetical protein